VKEIEEHKLSVGVALKPSEPLSRIEPMIPYIQFIQCMGNDKVGYNGVVLDESVYEKVRTLRELYKHMDISVDIGVNRETAPRLIEAGATKLISGSGIFKSADPIEEIKFYKKL